MSGLGLIGTDDGVGKTVVGAAIIGAMRAAGARVAPMKPIESGGSRDAELLSAAAGNAYPMRLVRPVVFDEPVAPLVAARRARFQIDVAALDAAFAELCGMSNAIVVEGTGGLLVPITESENFATLFRRWKLDVVIVVANRRGAVNHTLLTVEVARSHGLTVRAVVLNTVSQERGGTAERTNQAVLKELLLTIPIIRFPFTDRPRDVGHLAMLAQDLHVQTTMTRPAR